VNIHGFLGWVRSFVRRRATDEGGSVTHQVLLTQVVGYAFG
jgi:hypothetical protein